MKFLGFFFFFEPDFLAGDSPGQGPGLGRLAGSDRMAGLASSWVAAAPVALTKRIEHRRRLAIRTLAEGLGSQEKDKNSRFSKHRSRRFQLESLKNNSDFGVKMHPEILNWVCLC